MGVPRVSVLLTSWNRPDTVGRAIESVLEQTFQDWELLVADDNSSDSRVLDVLLSYKDPRISTFFFDTTEDERRRTARYATIINDLFNKSLGRYITYLCDDDYYFPTRLARMVKQMDLGSEMVWGTQLMHNVETDTRELRLANYVLTCGDSVVDHNSVMIRRDVVASVGGWSDDYAHWRWADAIFWRRLNLSGHVFDPLPNPEEPTDCKVYHTDCIDMRIRSGKLPWEHIV